MGRMAGLTWQRGQGGQGSPGRAVLWTGPLPLLPGLLLQPGPGWFQFSLLRKEAALLSGACPQEVGRFRTLPPDRGMHIKRLEGSFTHGWDGAIAQALFE